MKNVTNRISQIFRMAVVIGLLIACYVGARIERYVSYVTNEQDQILPGLVPSWSI